MDPQDKQLLQYLKRLRLICAIINRRIPTILCCYDRALEFYESVFIRVKHTKGKDLKREQVWIFGMYERSLDAKKFLFLECLNKLVRYYLTSPVNS